MAGFFRKLSKGLLWLVLTVIVLAALALCFSGTISRLYIHRHSKELIGREVSIGSLSINPFTAGIRAKDVHILEKDGKNDFLSLASLEGNINLRPIAHRVLKVRRLYADSLYVNIEQNGSAFNFDDIVEKISSYLDEDSRDSGWKMDLRNIGLSGGKLCYSDKQLGSRFTFSKISLDIPKISLDGKNTDVGTVLTFDQGGQMDCRLSYNPDRSRYTLLLKIKDIATDRITPYLQQFLNIRRCKGTVSGTLDIKGKTQHITDADIKGNLYAEDLKVIDSRRKAVFSAESLDAAISEFNLAKGIAHLQSLVIKGPQTYYEIMTDSTDNFSTLLKSDDLTYEDSNPSVRLLIDSLRIKDGKAEFKDLTLKESFSYRISEIGLECDGFRLDRMNILKGSAVASKAGKIDFEWTTDFVKMDNVYLDITASNINVKDFSPYSKYFVGNRIDGGTMRLESHNTIIGNHIDASNSIEIYRPKVSSRSKWSEPVYEVPVRLGVYALTNKKGMLKMNLPVKGNLDNPDFSYRKTLLKAMFNMFTKVSAAPMRAIGNLLGREEDMDRIFIDLSSEDFSTKEYGKLDLIVEAMKEKDGFHYTFAQRFNLRKALRKEEKDRILALAKARNENLSNYLRRMGLSSGSYTVEPVSEDSLASYKGKECFLVNAVWEDGD